MAAPVGTITMDLYAVPAGASVPSGHKVGVVEIPAHVSVRDAHVTLTAVGDSSEVLRPNGR